MKWNDGIPYHTTLRHITSHHVTSCHIISHHITSHHTSSTLTHHFHYPTHPGHLSRTHCDSLDESRYTCCGRVRHRHHGLHQILPCTQDRWRRLNNINSINKTRNKNKVCEFMSSRTLWASFSPVHETRHTRMRRDNIMWHVSPLSWIRDSSN